MTGYLAVALLIGALATAAPAAATRSVRHHDTWVGQVVRHHRHFDYRGSYCPKGTEVCIQVVAKFRIVPLTPEVAIRLRRVAGRQAKLVGYRSPAADGHHNGTLYVRRVRRA